MNEDMDAFIKEFQTFTGRNGLDIDQTLVLFQAYQTSRLANAMEGILALANDGDDDDERPDKTGS